MSLKEKLFSVQRSLSFDHSVPLVCDGDGFTFAAVAPLCIMLRRPWGD